MHCTTNSPQTITLQEVTADTVRRVCALSNTLSEAQRNMVADNAVSIAEAYFCDKAWFRAIYAHSEPVGFVMLHMGGDSGEEDHDYNGVFLWRFMIAGPHQGKGYGSKVIEILKKQLKDQGIKELMTSYVMAAGNPGEFYQKMGFVPTGKVYGGEAAALLKLE